MRAEVFFILMLGAAIATVAADSSPAQIDPSLLAEIRKTAALADSIRDLRAQFTQEKHSALLKAPLLSRGRLLIRGPVMRWNTEHPASMVTYITSQELTLYYPEDAQAEAYPILERFAAFVASPLPRIDVLLERFSIRRREGAGDSALLQLAMTPKEDELRKHLKSIEVDVELATGVARRIDMTDGQGDRTVFLLSEIRINTGMAEDEIDLKLPAGTKISRPLAPKESTDGR